MPEDLFNIMLKQMLAVCVACECPYVSFCSQENGLGAVTVKSKSSFFPPLPKILFQSIFIALIKAKCKLGKTGHIMNV